MINPWLFFLGIAGFIVAFYIAYKKHKQEHMVCVIGKKCEEVIYSKYNKLFGFPNEYLGMIYYAGVAILTLIFLYGTQTIFSISIETILIIGAIIGVIASAWFTYVQFIILKATCDYCITSAIINVLILITEIV